MTIKERIQKAIDNKETLTLYVQTDFLYTVSHYKPGDIFAFDDDMISLHSETGAEVDITFEGSPAVYGADEDEIAGDVFTICFN